MSLDGYTVSLETLTKLGRGDIKAGRRVLRAFLDIESEHEPIVGPTPKPPSVRAAVEADEAAILALIREDLQENAERVAPPDETKIMSIVRDATRKGHGCVGIIDAPDGALAGMICLVPYAWWWSERWFVMEMWNFVSAAHRASRHGADLVKFSRWFADSMSDKLGYRVYLLSGVTAVKGVYAKMAMYRRLLNYCGGFFVYPAP